MADAPAVQPTTPAAAPTPVDAGAQLTELKKMFEAQAATTATLTKAVDELAKQPVYPQGFQKGWLAGAPNVSRQVGERPYSLMSAFGFATGKLNGDKCVEERQISDKLNKAYAEYRGFQGQTDRAGYMLIPMGVSMIPDVSDEVISLKREISQKMAAGTDGATPDEINWTMNRLPYAQKQYYQKALGSITDTAGGSLVGFPQLGELIDLQRNLEVFPKAGATEVALPQNGLYDFPKLTAGATANWVGEAATIATSQQTTGSLSLKAKKLAVLVPVNNELFRFANPSAEAMIRLDMARVAAIKADVTMLSDGVGGTSPLALIGYSDITTYTASTDLGANVGYKFEPQDVEGMEGALPDAVQNPTAFIVRRDFYAKIKNRRADGVNPGDGSGPFMFDITRTGENGPYPELVGTPVIRSTQVNKTRTRGTASTLTYVILGYFPDWIIARLGVAEVLMNPYADSVGGGSNGFSYDQTYIRLVQHLDAGARHGASFVLCDQLKVI